MKTRKFIVDAILNIMSVAMPILVLQLFSFPLIAGTLGVEKYGMTVVFISAITVIGFPVGNVLNNTRLLLSEKYEKKNLQGDFNVLLLGGSLFSSLLMIFFSIFIGTEISMLNIALLVMIIIFTVMREYLIVSFRLELNYKNILVDNVVLSVGYFIGTFIFIMTLKWQYLYLIGLLCSLIFIVRKTSLLKEPFTKTKMFKATTFKATALYVSNVLKNFINHADKLIMLPFLGATNVAIYYSASIIGKMISMFINPVNTVMLSYLVKEKEISSKVFLRLLLGVLLTGVIGYGLTLSISPYFLGFFYPEWAEESLEIIKITTATAIVAIITAIIHPFNLRYNKSSLQVYMAVIHLMAYVLLTYNFSKEYGLIGFSLGVLIASILNLFVQLTVYLLSSIKK